MSSRECRPSASLAPPVPAKSLWQIGPDLLWEVRRHATATGRAGLADKLDFDPLLVGDGESILRDAKARLEELTLTFTDSNR